MMLKKTANRTARRLKKNRNGLSPDEPLLHQDHSRPVTRRDFLRQGFITGTGITVGGSLFSLFANPREAQAALSGDILNLFDGNTSCALGAAGGTIPFICFDLAGGSNMIGSNVLAGGQGGHLNDPISVAGYSKMGIPGGMIPGTADLAATGRSGPNSDWIDNTLGLPFHSDSGFLRGILQSINPTTAGFVNGAVIPARSDNDTGNNPHNPMYNIAHTGADGSVVTLIGSRSSMSGGNSMAPAMSINPTLSPTKVDRPSDVVGMVDTGDLVGNGLTEEDAKAVMESIARLSDKKVAKIDADAVVKDLVNCGYLGAADIAERFVGQVIDPAADANIVGASGIFSQADFDDEGEFRKTAAVMKMVIEGYAGAGTITMGGFDYHTGDRATGERRDERAGRCMGACLEYAARRGQPLMMYVFSDGSVASNGSIDGTNDGRNKGVWTGDNSSTAGSFFLVYNPPGLQGGTGVQASLFSGDTLGDERHQQLGWFRADGSVETASSVAANNVNLLVDTVVLNYLALHGSGYRDVYRSLFPNNDLGTDAHMMSLTAFDPIRT